MRNSCPVVCVSLLSKSMKGNEVESNAWQYSVCKCVKKRGRKRHPQILCNVPGDIQCCRPHTCWLHRKGKWRWWMDEAMPEHLCTRPASLEVMSAQWRRWGGRWHSLLSPFPALKEKIERFFSVWPFASWNAGGEHVKTKQGLQKAKLGESWSSPSSLFWCKNCFKLFSQVTPGLGLWLAFTVVESTHV